MIDTPRHSRRLLPLFLATTLVPTVCLGWLGWSVVVNDLQAQSDAVDGERKQAADLAASAFERVLLEAEVRLTSFDAAPASGAQGAAEGIALVVLGPGGVLERGGTPLPFYPVLQDPPADLERFAAVNELEYQKKDYAGALHALEAMTRSEAPAVSADVLLRLAVIRGRLGSTRQALEAFTALGTLGDTRVAGRPAAVVARHGRALFFEHARRLDDLRREAAAMCADLESGRWVISRGVFESLSDQARNWLGEARPRIDPDRLALAEAVDSLWGEWRASVAPNGRGRQTLHAGNVPVLVLTRSSPERRTALMMTPRYLESAWLKGPNSPSRVQGIDFALTDLDGGTVLGRPDAPPSMQSKRPATTQVPWTVIAISRPASPTRGMSRQTKLVLAGIIMTGLVALAGGYAINRALLRELRVARLQSDFVAAVSHEFRTPLTTVRQLAEMLAKGRVSSDERRQQFYETLLGESTRLQRLVEGLLNFGRMEAGELRYRFEPVDPEEFVRGIVSEFERDVAGRGYRIELHGNGTLPPIRADRESLARVFWNLLDNAVKYSPDSRTVWVNLSEAGRRLAVRVRDRGIGIPAAEQKEIFRKFVRGAASTDASIQGTGVGLAMARQIVAAHGGDISVESRPGEGSVFTVLLPVAET